MKQFLWAAGVFGNLLFWIGTALGGLYGAVQIVVSLTRWL